MKENIIDNLNLYSKDIDAINSSLNLKKNEFNNSFNGLKNEVNDYFTEINNKIEKNKKDDEIILNNNFQTLNKLSLFTENCTSEERKKRQDFNISINSLLNETIKNLNSVNKLE